MKTKTHLLLQANQARIDHQWLDAISYYNEILESHDNDIEVMWTLAVTYFVSSLEQSGTYESGQEALYWIDKAIEREPKRAEFYITRGEILQFALDAPDYEEAARSFRTALEIRPDAIYACLGLSNLVDVPENVVSLSEAVTFLERAAIVQPENSHVFLRLGTLYKKMGQSHKSQEFYRRALLCPKPLSRQIVLEIET